MRRSTASFVALSAALVIHPGVPSLRSVAAAPHRIAVVEGLSSPEALSFDPGQKVYFISNINGTPGTKHGTGFISRVTADGVLDSLHFIQGGRGGVALDAPMGSRVQGDTLWVLDVGVLRGFNTHTGAPITTIDVSAVNPRFLNDLAIDPTGAFYITDTGVQFGADGAVTHPGPDQIIRVGHDRKVSVALASPALMSPDGIDWDQRGKRFVLAPIGGPAVQQWHAGDAAPSDVAKAKGMYDGIEIERGGTILITSWADSTISTLEGSTLVPRIGKLPFPPADVSMDVAHSRVGIVGLTANRFELWEWPFGK